MGLFQQILRWIGLAPPQRPRGGSAARPSEDPNDLSRLAGFGSSGTTSAANTVEISTSSAVPDQRPSTSYKPRLVPLHYRLAQPAKTHWIADEVDGPDPPYRYAYYGSRTGRFLDLSQDGSADKLARYDLPQCQVPEQLADWLGVSPSMLAWLTHHATNGRPQTVEASHYHYHWMRKRTTGWRLIEAPKVVLKTIQQRVLDDILSRVPPHRTAHGFRPGRSIVTNAEPHVGKAVLLKIDLENFYANVRFSRVTAIFRELGYSREAAIWLARLTTAALPSGMKFPGNDPRALHPYLPFHLPQGAATSPALANLSAYSLDVRLSGLANSFGGTYTRYADDLTFSGSDAFARSLKTFIPLTEQVIRDERFRVNRRKRRVIRSSQRQIVTGVVVNETISCSREAYDRLKAILTNCVRTGPMVQNRDAHPRWAEHLQGRISHLRQLNATRGARLQEIYDRIDWNA